MVLSAHSGLFYTMQIERTDKDIVIHLASETDLTGLQ